MTIEVPRVVFETIIQCEICGGWYGKEHYLNWRMTGAVTRYDLRESSHPLFFCSTTCFIRHYALEEKHYKPGPESQRFLRKGEI